LKCLQCTHTDTKVIESREGTDGESIRRRRGCEACGFRFTTYERMERPQVIVVKNNGNRELFNRAKLLAGLYRACEKTPVTQLQMERVTADIEHQLQQGSEQEVPTSAIGEMVMHRLALTNEVAYVRFASVYRRFTDIAGFEQELLQIRQARK